MNALSLSALASALVLLLGPLVVELTDFAGLFQPAF